VEPADLALTAGVMLHLGFQGTVTVLVYPALVRRGLSHPDEWPADHARHSRVIVPLVGVVYVGLLAASGWSLSTGPGLLAALAVLGAGAAVAVTAILAAPLHGRLTSPDPSLLARLLAIDRLRCALAGAAGVAVLSRLVL